MAIKASKIASVPEEQVIAYFEPEKLTKSFSKTSTSSPKI